MRNVFCKAEDPKQTIQSFAKRLHEKYGLDYNQISCNYDDNSLDAGYYHVHFCKEREWEILSTTRPGSGYLTIPFNRLLLSKNGVNPEDCKLNTLFELIAESAEPVIGVDVAPKMDVTVNTDITPEMAMQYTEIHKEKEPVNEEEKEEDIPVMEYPQVDGITPTVVVTEDAKPKEKVKVEQTDPHSAPTKVHKPMEKQKIQFNI